jgi:hypothetical protein
LPLFNNFSSLKTYIKDSVKETLQNEVFEEIRDEEQKNIQSEVYDVYSPRKYRRRGMNGGLISDENIKPILINDTTLEVINETPPNAGYNGTTNKNLPELIEYGEGYKGYHYDYPTDPAFTSPRPFTESTIQSLKQSKRHVAALKRGLKSKGIDVI